MERSATHRWEIGAGDLSPTRVDRSATPLVGKWRYQRSAPNDPTGPGTRAAPSKNPALGSRPAGKLGLESLRMHQSSILMHMGAETGGSDQLPISVMATKLRNLLRIRHCLSPKLRDWTRLCELRSRSPKPLQSPLGRASERAQVVFDGQPDASRIDSVVLVPQEVASARTSAHGTSGHNSSARSSSPSPS
jgi:hypothetical protein